MEMNLSAFMKEELKDRGTMEFPGIEKFTGGDGKPVPFIIKRLSRKEVRNIQELYRTTSVYRDRQDGDRPVVQDGQVAVLKDYDAFRASRHMMVDAFVQPKLDDPKLMEFYGVVNRIDMPDVIFADRADLQYANDCLMIALGLKGESKEKEKVETIKN